MKESRNKSHGEGMKLLGVYMPEELKDRIKQAAKIKRRITSDWVRLVLEDASNEVLAKHAARTTALPTPAETHPEAPNHLSMVADAKTSSPSTPAHGVRPLKYPAGRTRKKA